MKSFRGLVISLKNRDTAVVRVETLKVHKKYKKVVKLSRKFQVHYDSKNVNLELNQKVVIKSSRPISATKKFVISK